MLTVLTTEDAVKALRAQRLLSSYLSRPLKI